MSREQKSLNLLTAQKFVMSRNYWKNFIPGEMQI